jgi:hypothetical protein
MRNLENLILDLDFSIASDALETFENILTAQRKPFFPSNEALNSFIVLYAKDLLAIFYHVKHCTMPKEDEGD